MGGRLQEAVVFEASIAASSPFTSEFRAPRVVRGLPECLLLARTEPWKEDRFPVTKKSSVLGRSLALREGEGSREPLGAAQVTRGWAPPPRQAGGGQSPLGRERTGEPR